VKENIPAKFQNRVKLNNKEKKEGKRNKRIPKEERTKIEKRTFGSQRRRTDPSSNESYIKDNIL